MTKTFTAVIEWDSESQVYVGMIPGIPGAHTQGKTLDDLRINLIEVLELCLEEMEDDTIPCFIGTQQIEVSI